VLLLCFTTTVACFLSLLANRLIEPSLTTPWWLWVDTVGLRIAHNPGIAFSVELHWLELPVIIGALITVAVLAFAHGKQSVLMRLGFGLILGGAVANLIDRLTDGFVTDYIQVSTFPTFNVADSCITIGIAVLLIENVWREKEQRKQN
jgi:signal peptidase II